VSGPVSGGDETGFSSYVRDVAPDLLAYFARRVWPTEDAADCVAEALVVLWRRRAELPRDHDAARAWAFGVARGVLSNYRRAGARRLALADAVRSAVETRHVSHHGELRSVLVDALASLREADRELVLLVAWEGLSLEAASTELGIKPAAARARYSRTRAKLRIAIGS
jgi:RNA polymerase sigma-70 factor (ECF subfamily)